MSDKNKQDRTRPKPANRPKPTDGETIHCPKCKTWIAVIDAKTKLVLSRKGDFGNIRFGTDGEPLFAKDAPCPTPACRMVWLLDAKTGEIFPERP